MIQSFLALVIGVVSAQTTTTTTTPATNTQTTLQAPPPSEVKAKKIVVTGSYIKRVDEEGPAAVQTFNAQDLQKQGQNSVADVLRNTALTSSVSREASGSNQAGTATVSIRGFGAGDVLVLLNGQRLPKMGGDNTVDLNLIPISALERVEVLKDGASALYGSDALGGVINFITKKDFNGSAISARYSLPEEKGGNRLDLVGTTGFADDKKSLLAVLQYRKNKAIFDRDRSYARVQDTASEGSPTGSPGHWINIANGTKNDFPLDPCPPGQKDPQGNCRYDYSKTASGLPDLEQFSAMLYGTYKLSDTLDVSMNTIYNRRNVEYVFAPGPGRFNVDATTATAMGIAAPSGAQIFYRTVEELGTRNTRNTSDAIIAQPTIEGKIMSWDWELAGSYGLTNTRNENYNGYAIRDLMIAAINNGSWNPAAAPGNKGSLQDARYSPYQDITTSQASARLLTTGQIYGGGDTFGPLAGAIGVSADRQDYKERVDSLTTLSADIGDPNYIFGGGAGSRGEGDRNSYSVFTELSFFPVDSIEAGFAIRYDKFSDFGDTINPKLSLSYQMSEKTLLRASVGTGFRAPNLSSLYQGSSTGFLAFIDRKGCNLGVANGCAASQYQVNQAGNPDLTEEKSIFYNLGMATQPKKNWSFTTDAFYAEIKDRVGLNLRDLTRVEEILGPAGVLSQYGINIVRLPSNEIDRIDNVRELNLSTSKVGGFDFTLKNETPGKFFGVPVTYQTAFDHQHVLYSRFNTFSILPAERNRDLEWRNVISFGVKTEKQFYRIGMRTQPMSDKSGNEGAFQDVGYGSLPTYTEWDFDYTYAGLYKGTLSFGIRNVLGSDRPLDDTVGIRADQLDQSIYDPVGRAFYLGYTYDF